MKPNCFPIEDLYIIIAAAGSSQRYRRGDKLMEMLDGIPLFLHSIRAFLPLADPSRIVVAVASGRLEDFRRRAAEYLPPTARLRWIAGGATRSETVRRALAELPGDKGFVAIHDAARPLADADLLLRVLAAARECGGALPGRRVTDSIKIVDEHGMIVEAVDRSLLWRAETPQIFDLEKLRRAYLRPGEATDDAEIMRRSGWKVKMVEAAAPNPKLTTPEELEEIRMLLHQRRHSAAEN